MIQLTWQVVEGAGGYRLMVYDRTDAQTLFDEQVAGPPHSVPLTQDQRRHDLVMRVRALRRSSWGDWTEFQPLPVDVVLGERRESMPILSPGDDPGLLLMFTVDTECSILRQHNPNSGRVVDELIFGDFDNGFAPGGIGLHMDLLEHFGFRGCFFVDVLMEYRHGQRALERAIEAISERGHEIELHVHADHLERSSDPKVSCLSGALGEDKDPDRFCRLIELSVDLFERRVGRPPIAYRAGGYRIADMHFPVLEDFGIRIDSSVQPYYNSRVSDWMRTRTQPFWVGGVLEVPPTLLLLNENSNAWETRGFLPNPELGDPVSTLPVTSGSPPLVATFVSHSFQLLRCRQTTAPDAIEDFAKRLRSALPAELADHMLRWSPKEVRTFGDEVDDRLVSAVAGILRRIADRPDARCATYADLVTLTERSWPAERHPAVDPIPLLDRRRGITGVTGTRVFGRELLAHLARRESSLPARPDGDLDNAWIEGLEVGPATELRARVDSAVEELEPGATLRARLRTLGVAAPGRRGMLPPLAELLFPEAAVRAVAAEMGVEGSEAVAWDAATFLAWFREQGFEIARERRIARPLEEMTSEPFAEKLRWLDPHELKIEALEVELRPSGVSGSLRHRDARPFEVLTHEPIPVVELSSCIGPESLPAASSELFQELHPGQELRLRLSAMSAPSSLTTILLALMRAGLEVLGTACGRGGFEHRLVRPVDLSDIRRFAGLE